jgi:tetratricopeptide (TPR) repeat protein
MTTRPSAPSRATFALLPTVFLGALTGAAACNGPRVVHENPVLVTGQRVPPVDPSRDPAVLGALERQQAAAAARDSVMAVAAASCAGDACAALTRGEVTLGMTEAQVLAATRSTPAAWVARRAGNATALSAASLASPPADVIGEVALVQLVDGRVRSIGYREPQGMRVVQRPEDATPTGRARATADALIREGDQFNAAGDRAAALDRYDRALVLVPDDAMLQYRVATLLDLQLRPVEALMRYQRFLQSLELQRIEAVGNANAKLAEAIARAQQRIIVLERQAR